MKKLFLVGALALFGAMNAQENSIKANPLAFIGTGSDMVTYERVIGGTSSVGVGAGYGSYKIAGTKYTNIGGTIFYRYYFSEALKGWYGMANVAYNNGTIKYDQDFFGDDDGEDKDKFNSFGGGVRAGYQFLWDSGFTLDLNAGFTYVSFSYKNDNDAGFGDLGLKASGIVPSFGLGLGYSF
ncbi:MAG: DUF3575 domain-containing protein [Flavobacteriaceae bacterium]|jgi:hypothetical protein|nr:DUF3575 domain-containing protein [Flavobacteriaceae bacterium]